MKWLTDHHVPLWLLPIAFVVVVSLLFKGLAVLIGRVWPKSKDTSAPKSGQMSPGCAAAFGGVFVLAGLVALFFIMIRPIYRSTRAANWPTTSGTVLSSRVETSRDSDGHITYRVDIHFRYVAESRTYEGTQYDSSSGRMFSGFRNAKEAVVRANPPGHAVTVHYDPADPADAMLTTDLPPGTLTFGWIPLIFVGVGAAVMFYGGRGGRPGAPMPLPAVPTTASATSGRRKQFVGITIFALFWNAIVVAIWLATRSWFIVPFLVVGAMVLLLAVYSGLQLLNPVVSVTFARMPLRPGGRTGVTYAVGGNSLAVKYLQFSLEARERVSYTQGTDTRTETHVAWRLPLYETVRPVDMERGRFDIDLPADAMPTFLAVHNSLKWYLCCRGEIPHRPKIKDDFDVTVSADEGTR